MVQKPEQFALSSFMHEIADHGYAIVHTRKLLRLLGVGNKAARTWRLLADAWEDIGRPRDTLHIAEIDHGFYLLTNRTVETVISWANE